MNVINRAVGELTPYAKNAKKHDRRQIANVAESIRQYGFVQPIVVDRDGVIVIGHCRWEAAKKLGMTEVPCVSVDELTPEQVNALRIVDNKANESPWDLGLLAEELPELDLSGFEFDFSSVVKKTPEEIVQDDVPDVDETQEPVAKYGDVLRERKPLVNDLHPTMKPVKLIGKLVCNSTNEGGSVLDLFGRSGTTMIACEQLGRTCYMMELDPKYCDVIIRRWENFTGGKAVKIN